MRYTCRLTVLLTLALLIPGDAANARDMPFMNFVLDKSEETCKDAKTPKCGFDHVMPAVFAGAMDASDALADTFEKFGDAQKVEEVRSRIQRDAVYLDRWLNWLKDCWSKNKYIGCGTERLQP